MQIEHGIRFHEVERVSKMGGQSLIDENRRLALVSATAQEPLDSRQVFSSNKNVQIAKLPAIYAPEEPCRNVRSL